jgi:RNA-directed DNA polymerase
MLLEEIISKSNMQSAYKQVMGNKGAAGADGIGAASFPGQLKAEWELVRANLTAGTYQPQAVKRVSLPKSNGGERELGIPTYMDRLIQQAISQELTKMYDADFSENSYGFRSEKNAHQALQKARSTLMQATTT